MYAHGKVHGKFSHGAAMHAVDGFPVMTAAHKQGRRVSVLSFDGPTCHEE